MALDSIMLSVFLMISYLPIENFLENWILVHILLMKKFWNILNAQDFKIMYTVYLESNKKHKPQTSTSLSRRSFSNKLLSLSSFF